MDDFKDALRRLASVVGPTVLAYGIVLLLVSLPISGILWLQASQEAAAFNRFTTGPKATTWDALLVELRVEADR